MVLLDQIVCSMQMEIQYAIACVCAHAYVKYLHKFNAVLSPQLLLQSLDFYLVSKK